MGLGNGNANSGNKGSNWRYEYNVLKALECIVTSTSVVPDPCCPTAATEATLQSVLSVLQTGTSFQQALVIDTGGVGCPGACPTYLEIRIWNGVGFDPPIYYDADGNVVVPVGPLEFINPQFTLEDILVQVSSINTNTDGLEACCAAGNVLLSDIKDNQTNGTQRVIVDSGALPSGAATSANQTNGTQRTHITDGTDDALVTAAGELTVLATAQPGVDIGDVTINNASIAVTGPLTDAQLRATPVPVSGTVTITPSGTQAVNQTQINGIVVSTSTGATDTGTQRVVLATGGGNAPMNVAQINGVTPLMGAGATGTGSHRVTIASGGATIPISNTSLTTLGSTVQTVDNAYIGNETGLSVLSVRNDNASTDLSTTNNAYSPMAVDVKGAIFISTQQTAIPISTTSLTPGTGATNLGKAEDQASADLDVGVGALAIRQLTPANTSSLDGDYEFLKMSNGKLWVTPVGDVADNAPQVQVSPVYAGGVAVDITALPTFTAGDAAGLRVNKDTGALIVLQANLDNTQDTVTTMLKFTSNVTNTATRFRSLVVSTTGQTIKGSAGNLYGWNIVNLSATVIYVKFYNEVLGTSASTPIKTLQVPANGSVYQDPSAIQTTFSTGLSVRAVTGSADADATSPATLPIIEIEYA